MGKECAAGGRIKKIIIIRESAEQSKSGYECANCQQSIKSRRGLDLNKSRDTPQRKEEQ